jgi:hypothetical protein
MVSGVQCAVRGSSASRIAPPLFFGLRNIRLDERCGARMKVAMTYAIKS